MSGRFDTSVYRKWEDKINRKMVQAANEAMDKAWPEFLKRVDDRVTEIFTSAIDAFYMDYVPTGEDAYERKNDLYDLLIIDRNQDRIAIEFDPEKMQGFRDGYQDEDGLYDQVFRKGWHGGAGGIHEEKAEKYGVHPGYLPGGNVPVWRTPAPYYTRWGRPAEVMSPSPLELIHEGIDKYEAGQIAHDFKGCFDRHFANTKIRW